MDQRSYEKLVSRIDKLMKTRSKIVIYNLTGTANLENFSQREIEKLIIKNKKAHQKLNECNQLIAGTLILLEKAGYSVEDIMSRYSVNETSDIISMVYSADENEDEHHVRL